MIYKFFSEICLDLKSTMHNNDIFFQENKYKIYNKKTNLVIFCKKTNTIIYYKNNASDKITNEIITYINGNDDNKCHSARKGESRKIQKINAIKSKKLNT